MKHLIAFAVCAFIGGQLVAAQGTLVQLKTKVTDLPPNFLVSHKIVCPEGACQSRQSAPEFPSVLKGDVPQVITRCLEVHKGLLGYGVGIGISSDCGGFRGTQYKIIPSK